MWSDLTVSPDERRAICDAMRFALGGQARQSQEEEILLVASELLGGPLEGVMFPDPSSIAAALAPARVLASSGPEGSAVVASRSMRLRVRAVQSAMLATLMDEQVTPDEDRRVRALASALGVDEPRLNALHHLSQRHTALAWMDLARKSFARDAFEQALSKGGPGKLWKIVGPLLGMADDAVLSQRFIALGELPSGTLGRSYFEFILQNDLAFPGEHRAVPEAGLWHDLTHVLSGYSTSDEDEIRVVAFIAGYRKEDAFFWLFTIVLQYHLGLKVSPYSPGKRGLFDVRAAMAAYARGTHVVCDLERWDPWPHFARALDDVRRELGVPPH